MGISWSAVYLHGDVPRDLQPPIEGRVRVGRLGGWTECALGPVADAAPLAQALSTTLQCPVVAVQVQSTASVFMVLHLGPGAQVRRHLEFADGTWHRVDGEPQPWEGALFGEREREHALDAGYDAAALTALFERRHLETGSSIPWPHEFDAMLAVLGVSEAEWKDARARAPLFELEGTRRTLTPLMLLMLSVGLIITGLTLPSARALSLAFSAPLLVVAAGAGFLRRLRTGRWFL